MQTQKGPAAQAAGPLVFVYSAALSDAGPEAGSPSAAALSEAEVLSVGRLPAPSAMALVGSK